MVRRARGSKKGELWHGYRRPILRDGVFWVAAVTTVIALAAQNAWADLNTTLAWVLFGADLFLTIVIVFALIGVLAGTLRGFGEGWRSAERPAGSARPGAVPDGGAAPGAASDGATPTEPASKPKPQADPVPDAERPVLGIELEKKARALGRAIAATQRKARKP